MTKRRIRTDATTPRNPVTGTQCQKSFRRILYAKYAPISAETYVTRYLQSVKTSSAMLTLRKRSISAPFAIMHMKIRVRDDAESGMKP